MTDAERAIVSLATGRWLLTTDRLIPFASKLLGYEVRPNEIHPGDCAPFTRCGAERCKIPILRRRAEPFWVHLFERASTVETLDVAELNGWTTVSRVESLYS